jgi:hypothetical protein
MHQVRRAPDGSAARAAQLCYCLCNEITVVCMPVGVVSIARIERLVINCQAQSLGGKRSRREMLHASARNDMNMPLS